MNTLLGRTFGIAAIAGLLSACNSQPVKPIVHLPAWAAYVQDRHNQLDVVNVAESKGPGGEIKLGVTFASISTNPAAGYYSVVWFDESGIPIDTILSRQTPINLSSKEQRSVAAIAPGPRAKSYGIILEK